MKNSVKNNNGRIKLTIEEKMMLDPGMDLYQGISGWMVPSGIKGVMMCMDSSEKEEIGNTEEFIGEYHIVLKNFSHTNVCDVEIIRGMEGESMGSLAQKESMIVTEYPFWMFDWENSCLIRLRMSDSNYIIVELNIPKWKCEEKAYQLKKRRIV